MVAVFRSRILKQNFKISNFITFLLFIYFFKIHKQKWIIFRLLTFLLGNLVILLGDSRRDVTPDDPEEHVPTVQDAEINLLRSGDVT